MKEYKTYDENLGEEARAFDSQIRERVAGGHIPDLDNVEDCDYFYNNPWRRKYFVELDFGEQRDLILKTVDDNIKADKSEIRILEVGCGPGYMSLALARAGYNVTGLELAADCVSVAVETANKYSPELLKSGLDYVCDDLFKFTDTQDKQYDVVLFVGAMHHFPDQDQVHLACKKLLKKNGLLICHEPVRDRVSKRNAIANVLITTLLSMGNSYYSGVSDNFELEIDRSVDNKFAALRYELGDGEKVQSVNDNEAGYEEMYPLLTENYETLEFKWRYGVFHEIIGGLRLKTAQDEAKLARFIRDIDKLMCEENMIDPSEFYFVGKNSK